MRSHSSPLASLTTLFAGAFISTGAAFAQTLISVEALQPIVTSAADGSTTSPVTDIIPAGPITANLLQETNTPGPFTLPETRTAGIFEVELRSSGLILDSVARAHRISGPSLASSGPIDLVITYDFTPPNYGTIRINSRVEQNLPGAFSQASIDIDDDGSVELTSGLLDYEVPRDATSVQIRYRALASATQQPGATGVYREATTELRIALKPNICETTVVSQGCDFALLPPRPDINGNLQLNVVSDNAFLVLGFQLSPLQLPTPIGQIGTCSILPSLDVIAPFTPPSTPSIVEEIRIPLADYVASPVRFYVQAFRLNSAATRILSSTTYQLDCQP